MNKELASSLTINFTQVTESVNAFVMALKLTSASPRLLQTQEMKMWYDYE